MFVMCKNKVFVQLMKLNFNNEGIFISAICTQPSLGIIEFKNCCPTPDIVLMDAYWPNRAGQELLSEFLNTKAKVILTTTFPEVDVLKNFLPLEPHGYIYRNCDDFKIITNCIKQVYQGSKCNTVLQ